MMIIRFSFEGGLIFSFAAHIGDANQIARQ